MKFIRQFWTGVASKPVSVISYSIEPDRREIIFQSEKTELPLSFDEMDSLLDQLTKDSSEMTVKGFLVPTAMLRKASVDILMEMSNPPKPKEGGLQFWRPESPSAI